MYKAAIVGCGHRAPAHIEAYRHIPGAEVVACVAPTPTRRDALAAKYGLHAYADIGEMVRAERPDIVHLVTWPDTRVSLMTEVAELGVPLCTVEKPIATGVPDWRQLRALEARSKTRFAVCHQVRWHPYLMPCQDALRSGRLGRVRFLDISAGMNIAGQGTHTLNYGMSLMGDVPVARVFGNAHGWDAADPGHPGPATTEAYLTFADGGRGLWTSGFTSPRCGDPQTTWQHVRVAAYAENGRFCTRSSAGGRSSARTARRAAISAAWIPGGRTTCWRRPVSIGRCSTGWKMSGERPARICGSRCTSGRSSWRCIRARWSGVPSSWPTSIRRTIWWSGFEQPPRDVTAIGNRLRFLLRRSIHRRAQQ